MNRSMLFRLQHALEQVKNERLTLRMRVALLSGGLLLILSLGLVVFINVSATIVLDTSSIALAVPPPAPPDGSWQPGQPSPTPISLATLYNQPVTTADTDRIQQKLLGEVRFTSIIGLAFVAILGAVGAHYIAGVALRPVGQVARSARQIESRSLDKRLAVRAPRDEVRELVESFNSMLARLDRSFAQQSQFVANAAHELRTPLATLRTNLEVMYADEEARLEDYRTMAPVLERTVGRLERLVADLLVIASEESSVSQDEISLVPLVNEVVEELRPVAEAQRILLDISKRDEDVRIQGDGTLLARVFSNLVENSIKYNHAGGQVAVSVDQNSEYAQVTIADTGIGIPKDEQANIFGRFYRVDQSRSRHKGGSGLGLSIVAQILHLHGGHILVESTPGAGSRFTVRLPLLSAS